MKKPSLLLCTLIVTLTGCAPVVPFESFLTVANAFALGPDKNCLELANDFGLPAIEGIDNPADVGFPFIEEQIAVGDRSLRAWFIPAAEPQGVAVFSYGAVGEMTCYLWIVVNLLERGWSVAMYDFSGFGGSTGTPSLEFLVEDGRAAIDWAREISGADRVLLMGVSLGTIPSVAYAAEKPDAVSAVVVDGLISMRAEVARFSFLLGFFPEPYVQLLDPALLTDEQLPSVQAPMLAITYGRDEFVTSSIATQLLATSGGEVTRFDFADLGHVRGPYFDSQTYFTELADFLRRFVVNPERVPDVDLGSPFDFQPRPAAD